MAVLKRFEKNPIISPNVNSHWQSKATLNPTAVLIDGTIHIIYRAIGDDDISVLGHMTSLDGLNIVTKSFEPIFTQKINKPIEKKNQIGPYSSGGGEEGGVEDPRLTIIENRVYMIYTMFNGWDSVRMALTSISLEDFKKGNWNWSPSVLISPPGEVNKNWVLFPEKINGQYAILHGISPNILIEYVNDIKEFDGTKFIHSTPPTGKGHPNSWDSELRGVGPAPIKTKKGWLVLYHAIDTRDSNKYKLGAMLLDLNDPTKTLGISKKPILEPVEAYENEGLQNFVVYACGAVVKEGFLYVYYGGADTVTCVASIKLEPLLKDILSKQSFINKLILKFSKKEEKDIGFERFIKNPILSPNANNNWEAKAVLNPGAIYLNGKTHILYRAISSDDVSTIGYASSADGFNIDERLTQPIYEPRADFEIKKIAGAPSGCEDPRLTKIGDRIYMFYVAFDGLNPPQVAVTSILEEDFLKHDFNWSPAQTITPIGIEEKDACIFPEKIDGKYLVFHRIEKYICGDYLNSLDFETEKITKFTKVFGPRHLAWDSLKVGLATPPIKTAKGWILLYHAITERHQYKVGAVLLDLKKPTKVLARLDNPIFEPQEDYEKQGFVNNVVFPCGITLRSGTLYIYYGGANKVVGVATMKLDILLTALTRKLK